MNQAIYFIPALFCVSVNFSFSIFSNYLALLQT